MAEKKLLIANWKSNGTLVENSLLIENILSAQKLESDVVICPPFVYLLQIKNLLENSKFAEKIKLGAQNLSEYQFGAYTGEIAASMLKDIGVEFVLIGHSERRSLYGENDLVIAKKVSGALKAGLTPVLCLGESLEQREAGEAFSVVLKQLELGISQLASDDIAKIVIAYEPVWAIGTGKTASAEEAEEVHLQIRQYLQNLEKSDRLNSSVADKIKILYGGSLNETNVASLFKMPNIDGGLVGGASLDAQKFIYICNLGK